MKTTSILLAAAFAVALISNTNAAERERKGARAGATPERGAGRFLGAGIEGLDLTEDQKSKVQEFMQENRATMEGLRDASPEERREKLQKFQELVTAKMKEVLTKEQFEKWEKNRPGAAGAPGAGGGREAMQKIIDDLKLTSEQQEKMRAAMREQAEEMQGLRDAAPEERRQKFQKMQDAMTAKMKDILDKEQFEKWEKVRGQFGGRFGAGDAPRKKRE